MNFFGWITEGTRNAVLKGFELAAADLSLHHAANDESPLASLEARMLPAPEETPPSTPTTRRARG